MKLKKITGKVHLWLGLSSGLIVFIVSITGCMFAFEKEIQDALQDYRFVAASTRPILPPSALQASAERVLVDEHAHSVQYNTPERAAVVTFYSAKSYKLVYVDPYTAKVLKVKDEYTDFFFIVKMLHYCLLLPIPIGQPIVAGATLVFLIMVISGIILWWPKNRAAAKQRFWFRWKENVKWKRKNYDMHNILGFYACWIALFLALTGLVWGFEWYKNAYYAVFSGGKKIVEYYEPTSDTTRTVQASIPAIDRAWQILKKESPNAQVIEIHMPEKKSSSLVCVTNTNAGTYWRSDYRYFDQYTLKEIPVTSQYGRIDDATVADKIMRMNYDIHVGAIGGLTGKVIAFLASLVCASLPITGFYIWWGRKKKKAKKAKKQILQESMAASYGNLT